MEETFLFTSESVSEGHPDKMCDQISDAILDACLQQDENSRVACETATKTGFVMLLGEIKTKAVIDFQKVVRGVVRDIGYNHTDTGFDASTCSVLLALENQSEEISEAVDHISQNTPNSNPVSSSINGYKNNNESSQSSFEIGAGDQGLMFGYATDETPERMPLTVVLAHRIIHRLTECRKKKIIPWLLPDAKSQVTVEYKYDSNGNGEGACIPIRVHTVVVSTQTTDHVTLEEIKRTVKKEVVDYVIPNKYKDKNTIYHIQPSGKFTIGGPKSDAGLTGRKIIVDTYGGWGAHGGGAFSGKDYTKVDRSAAYAARWVAISLVNHGLCRRCLVQLSYAIGVAKPLSVTVNTYGTGTKSNAEILDIINKNFDLTPAAITKDLDLKKPIYRQTSVYGHFKPGFTWDIPKKLHVD